MSVHPSFCLSTPGGVPGQVQMGGGGTLARSRWGDPCQVPPIRPGEGYPWQGVPHLGYPPSDLVGAFPLLGGTPPQQVHPPIGSGQGVPLPGGTPPRVTDGVLDMPQSVCLLHSRRRTFLYESDLAKHFSNQCLLVLTFFVFFTI